MYIFCKTVRNAGKCVQNRAFFSNSKGGVEKGEKEIGLVRDLNPGPLAPKARIIPLDQRSPHTWLPPPVLPQVTPVKLAAIVQLSVSPPANPRSQVRSCSPVSEGRLDYLLLVRRELEETPQLQLCSVLASNGGRRLRVQGTSSARGLT